MGNLVNTHPVGCLYEFGDLLLVAIAALTPLVALFLL